MGGSLDESVQPVIASPGATSKIPKRKYVRKMKTQVTNVGGDLNGSVQTVIESADAKSKLPKRKYARKPKPPVLLEPLPRIQIKPVVDLAHTILNTDSGSANVDNPEHDTGNFVGSPARPSEELSNTTIQETVFMPRSANVDIPEHHADNFDRFIAPARPSEELPTDLISLITREFQSMHVRLESSNVLIRQTLVICRQTSKNMKTLFENESFDGFLSEFEIALPVTTIIQLQDLELRILNDDFRKSFVSLFI